MVWLEGCMSRKPMQDSTAIKWYSINQFKRDEDNDKWYIWAQNDHYKVVEQWVKSKWVPVAQPDYTASITSVIS